MTTTNNLGITLVAQNQAQKEVTVNQAITAIDALLNRGVVSKGNTTPPVSPASGDIYILGASPTGSWSGHGGKVAWYNGIWNFITPNEGMVIWVNNEDILYSYNGSSWVNDSSAVTKLDDLSDVVITSPATYDLLQYDGTHFVNKSAVDNVGRIGINASSDATNKLAVASDAILFNTSTGDMQLKLNKTSTSNTNSLLFQTGTSGRAEIGTVTDNNMQFKVSSDGSTFVQSFVVANSSGNVDFKQGVNFSGAVTCNNNLVTAPELKAYAETLSTNSSSGSSATIDLSNGNVQQLTLTANCTLTFSNAPASGKGGSFTLILKQDSTGSRTVTWPSSVKWSYATSPTLTTTANAVDIFTFITTDGGSTWYGFMSGVNMG